MAAVTASKKLPRARSLPNWPAKLTLSAIHPGNPTSDLFELFVAATTLGEDLETLLPLVKVHLKVHRIFHSVELVLVELSILHINSAARLCMWHIISNQHHV